jgi:SOS-response transcriptional repressor LexA
MTLGQRIRARRKAVGLSGTQLGDVFGIGRGSVSDWERDKTRPDQDKLQRLAEALETTVDELLTESAINSPVLVESTAYGKPTVSGRNVIDTPRTAGSLPVITWAQAGGWTKTMDEIRAGKETKWVTCPVAHSNQAFVLQVVGASMYNPQGELSFRDGDYICVDPAREPRHEALVVVTNATGEAAVFKQLMIESDGSMLLHVLNPAWPNQYQTLDTKSSIVGVVTGQWRAL